MSEEKTDDKVDDKTDDQIKDEIRDAVENDAENSDDKSIEDQARELGWHPDGKNMFGETVSPERYLDEKPLYNTIGKLKSSLTTVDKKVAALQENAKSMASNFIKEKENLLSQLEDAKETALTNLEADEVRKIDKQIKSVQEEINTAEVEDSVSPYYGAFLEDNEWAEDDDDVRTIAAESIAMRYKRTHPKAGDKELYDHIHKQVREKFSEKFAKPAQKVGSANKRVTSSATKKKTVTLADLDAEEARIVQVMIDSIPGMTEEKYMKDYEL